MRQPSAPRALLLTYRIFTLCLSCFLFVIRQGSSYILKNAYRVGNYTFTKGMQCQNTDVNMRGYLAPLKLCFKRIFHRLFNKWNIFKVVAFYKERTKRT